MRKSLILASMALVFAVGAAMPKGVSKLDYDAAVFVDDGPLLLAEASAVTRTYPPCRSRSDDNCIQIRGRPARSARLTVDLPAMGGPYERIGPYPDCSRTIADECVQRFDRARLPARRAGRPAAPAEPETPGI